MNQQNMTSKKGLRARHRIAKRRLRSPESKQHGEEAGPSVSAPLVAGSHQPCDRLLLVTPASSTIHSPPSSLKGLIENPVFSGPLTATCDKMATIFGQGDVSTGQPRTSGKFSKTVAGLSLLLSLCSFLRPASDHLGREAKQQMPRCLKTLEPPGQPWRAYLQTSFTERVINFYLVEATLLGFFLFYADNSPNCRRQSSYLEADHLRLEAALLIWGKKISIGLLIKQNQRLQRIPDRGV